MTSVITSDLAKKLQSTWKWHFTPVFALSPRRWCTFGSNGTGGWSRRQAGWGSRSQQPLSSQLILSSPCPRPAVREGPALSRITRVSLSWEAHRTPRFLVWSWVWSWVGHPVPNQKGPACRRTRCRLSQERRRVWRGAQEAEGAGRSEPPQGHGGAAQPSGISSCEGLRSSWRSRS